MPGPSIATDSVMRSTTISQPSIHTSHNTNKRKHQRCEREKTSAALFSAHKGDLHPAAPAPARPSRATCKAFVGLPRSIASASNPLHLLPYRPRSPLVVPPRNAGNHRASCRLLSARPCSRRSGATDHRTFNCTLISGSEMTTQQPESRHESAHSLVVCVPRFVAQDRSAMQSACAGWPDDRSGERGVSPKRASSRFESGQFAGVSAGLRAACVVARPNRASENGRKNNREGEQYASWRKLVVCGTRSRNRQKTQHWCGHNSPRPDPA